MLFNKGEIYVPTSQQLNIYEQWKYGFDKNTVILIEDGALDRPQLQRMLLSSIVRRLEAEHSQQFEVENNNKIILKKSTS